MPEFKNPTLKELYACDFFIEEEILEDILEAGPDAASDLESVLEDALTNTEHYEKGLDWYDAFFVNHALYLLYELNAESSVGTILKFLEADPETLDFWFGHEGLINEVPEVLIKLAGNSPQLLENFLTDSPASLTAKGSVSFALTQICLHFPEQRERIVAFFSGYLDKFSQYEGDLSDFSDPYDSEEVLNGTDINEYLCDLALSISTAGLTELKDKTIEFCETVIQDDSLTFSSRMEFDADKMYLHESIFEKYRDFRNSVYADDSPHHPDAKPRKELSADEEDQFNEFFGFAKTKPNKEVVGPKKMRGK